MPFHDHVRAADVESLPILDAIIKETLRLYPPVAGCQPRVTVKKVLLGSKENPIAVLPGVVVHAQAWTLHRNLEVFGDPEEFRPERWLDCASDKREAMDAVFWAFGSGSRKCLGEILVMSSLKVALATIYSRFETQMLENMKFKLNIGNMLLPIAQDETFLRLRIRKAGK